MRMYTTISFHTEKNFIHTHTHTHTHKHTPTYQTVQNSGVSKTLEIMDFITIAEEETGNLYHHAGNRKESQVREEEANALSFNFPDYPSGVDEGSENNHDKAKPPPPTRCQSVGDAEGEGQYDDGSGKHAHMSDGSGEHARSDMCVLPRHSRLPPPALENTQPRMRESAAERVVAATPLCFESGGAMLVGGSVRESAPTSLVAASVVAASAPTARPSDKDTDTTKRYTDNGATDVQATDVQAVFRRPRTKQLYADNGATDIEATDVQATDVQAAFRRRHSYNEDTVRRRHSYSEGVILPGAIFVTHGEGAIGPGAIFSRPTPAELLRGVPSTPPRPSHENGDQEQEAAAAHGAWDDELLLGVQGSRDAGVAGAGVATGRSASSHQVPQHQEPVPSGGKGHALGGVKVQGVESDDSQAPAPWQGEADQVVKGEGAVRKKMGVTLCGGGGQGVERDEFSRGGCPLRRRAASPCSCVLQGEAHVLSPLAEAHVLSPLSPAALYVPLVCFDVEEKDGSSCTSITRSIRHKPPHHTDCEIEAIKQEMQERTRESEEMKQEMQGHIAELVVARSEQEAQIEELKSQVSHLSEELWRERAMSAEDRQKEREVRERGESEADYKIQLLEVQAATYLDKLVQAHRQIKELSDKLQTVCLERDHVEYQREHFAQKLDALQLPAVHVRAMFAEMYAEIEMRHAEIEVRQGEMSAEIATRHAQRRQALEDMEDTCRRYQVHLLHCYNITNTDLETLWRNNLDLEMLNVQHEAIKEARAGTQITCFTCKQVLQLTWRRLCSGRRERGW